MVLYSVKMRSSADGAHISGAERIVEEDEVAGVCAAMSRGRLFLVGTDQSTDLIDYLEHVPVLVGEPS